MPVVAANRFGIERSTKTEITFYGSSFICDNTGAIISSASRDAEEVLVAQFDREALAATRLSWGLFRDRRPDLYGPLLTLDGETE